MFIKKPCSAILSLRGSAMLLTSLCSNALFAADVSPKKLENVVVTANLTPTSAAKVGSAITVITAQEIEQQQVTYVSDILRTVPGLAVSQSGGGFGTLTQVRIRGSEGNHTLVRLNGIELNDPSGGSEYNFGNLLAENIERIEIIRGAQSALYGSDAIGGVINIITKRGNQGLKLNAQVQGGSFGTYKTGGGISGGWKDKVDFAVNVTQFKSDGISIAASGTEKDGNQNLSVDGNFNVNILKNWQMGVTGRWVNSDTDTDGFKGGIGAVDANTKTKTKQKFGSLFTQFSLFENSHWLKWDHKFTVSYSGNNRDNLKDNTLNSQYDGEKSKYAYQTNLSIDTSNFAQSHHTFTFLVEHEKNSVRTNSSFSHLNKSVQTTSYVGEYQLDLFDRLYLSGGIRADNNDKLFNDTVTYRTAASYLLKETDTRLHTSYGTGVKNPTLFELFGFTANYQGNPNLTAEKSKSFDIGLEQRFLKGRVSLDTTYYNNQIDNLIVGSGKRSVNQPGKNHIEGIEVAIRATIIDNLDFTGSYTWNANRDAKGVSLVRRAKHIASANLDYGFQVFGNQANINLGIKYNGKQTDFAFDKNFNRSIVSLHDYTLINIAASYQIFDQVELFARAENLLNQHYQEVYSYATKGIAGYGGIRISFEAL